MAPKTKTLYLVSQASKIKGIATLRKKFAAVGYKLEVRPAVQPEQAANQLPAAASGVVFVDAASEYVEAFGQALKSVPGGPRILPLLYGYSAGLQAPGLAAGAIAVVHDFFPLAEPAPRLGLRLALRERQALERAAAVRLHQDQSLAIAKGDTALKQREEFLGVCAHDLRSPLGLIQTCLAMVLKAAPGDGGTLERLHWELLARAHRQSGHALGLVKDLLDVMALDQGLKPLYQILELDRLLAEFCADYSVEAAQKNIRFHYFNPVPEWRVLADADRMRQLLQNLFTNALKFSESGKNIYLNVAPFQGRRKHDPPHPMVIISLRDEGHGIAQGELEKIFDRFTQIKEHARDGGRGLGLSVAKQISTLHDGNIWVESEQGKGSTFFVLFPHTLVRKEFPSHNPAPQRILVAESNAGTRQAIVQQLEGWGLEVHCANDGVEAVTLLYHHWPDALLLGAGVSKLDAAGVANLLKADPRTAGVPIVLVGSPSPQHQNILADAHLAPGFQKAEWLRVVESLRPSRKKAA